MNERPLCWRWCPPLFLSPQKGFLFVCCWRESLCVFSKAFDCFGRALVNSISRVMELTGEGVHAAVLRARSKSGDEAILEGD